MRSGFTGMPNDGVKELAARVGATWSGGQVLAVAYDVMIPGYGTKSTNNLRLWESKPKRGFDLQSFNGPLILYTHP
jgi:starch phosphorylase